MNNPANISADSFFAGLVREIIEGIRQEVGLPISGPENTLGIELMHVYSVNKTAKFLGISKNAVYKIPDSLLPRVRRTEGTIGFYGINILRYTHSLDPIDTEVMTKRLSRKVLELIEASASPTKVTPMKLSRGGETRVM